MSIESETKKKELMRNFIRCYRSLPELWNVNYPLYNNRNAKSEGYEKLLEVYRKLDPEGTRYTVVKRINSLRSNFRKEVKKIRKSKQAENGKDFVYTPRLWYFNELTFLIDMETQSHSTEDLDIEHELDLEETEEINTQYSIEEHYVTDSSTEDRSNGSAYKRIKTEKSMGIFKYQPKYSTIDDDDYLIMSKGYAIKLKNMDPLQRIYADKLINNVLSEGLLNGLNRTTKIIDSDMQQI